MKTLVLLSAACGVGKTTIKDALKEGHLLDNYAFIDIDQVGINWWNYAGTDHEYQYTEDCLGEAFRMAKDKNLFFTACMNPDDFLGKVTIPEDVSSTIFIGMTCSDEAITRRLKARPAERKCGNDEFITGQIQYNQWFKKNSGKFSFCIDNTNKTIRETAETIAAFVRNAADQC